MGTGNFEMVKMRKEKSEICVFNKIPFPNDLSVKKMLEEKLSCLVSFNRGVLYQ